MFQLAVSFQRCDLMGRRHYRRKQRNQRKAALKKEQEMQAAQEKQQQLKRARQKAPVDGGQNDGCAKSGEKDLEGDDEDDGNVSSTEDLLVSYCEFCLAACRRYLPTLGRARRI